LKLANNLIPQQARSKFRWLMIAKPLLMTRSPSPEKKPGQAFLSELEPPPVLGTWRRMYTVVLVVHALLIIGFWLFGRYWSGS